MLEIGVLEDGSVFRALADGDSVTVWTGVGALYYLELLLRVRDATPSESDPRITVSADGQLAGDTEPHLEWTRASDAPGSWLLRPRFVVLLMDTCCLLCREALIEASAETTDDLVLEESVRALVTRGAPCPDEDACCLYPDACAGLTMTPACAPPPGG